MSVNVRDWLDRDLESVDVYQLLGRKLFDPDHAALRKAVQDAIRGVHPYQGHVDSTIAAKAIKLQYAIARVSELLDQKEKLRSYHCELLAELRVRLANVMDLQTDPATIRQLLIDVAGVHPHAVGIVRELFRSSSADACATELELLQANYTSPASSVGALEVGKRLPAATKEESTAVAEVELVRNFDWKELPARFRVTAGQILASVDHFLGSLAGEGNTLVHNFLRVALVLVLIVGTPLSLVIAGPYVQRQVSQKLLWTIAKLDRQKREPPPAKSKSKETPTNESPTNELPTTESPTTESPVKNAPLGNEPADPKLATAPLPRSHEPESKSDGKDPSGDGRPPPAPEAPSTVNGLPILETVRWSWKPRAPHFVAQVAAHRNSVLSVMPPDDLVWDELLHQIFLPPPGPFGPIPPDPSSSAPKNVTLPERFMLAGKLHSVRVAGDVTWVYLSASRQLAIMMPPVAIEFSGAETAQWMADYSRNDLVRIAVRRHNWGEFGKTDIPVGLMPPGPAQWHARLSERAPETRLFMSFRPMPYWSLKGLGLELPGRDNSWVAPRLGRSTEIANPNDVSRDPGMIFRNLPLHAGRQGILKARFERVETATAGLLLHLTVETSEGNLPVMADLGLEAKGNELFDYHSGDEVAATIRLRAPRVSRHLVDKKPLGRGMPGFLLLKSAEELDPDPLQSWTMIEADCLSIHKVTDPIASLVNASGPRRRVGTSQ